MEGQTIEDGAERYKMKLDMKDSVTFIEVNRVVRALTFFSVQPDLIWTCCNSEWNISYFESSHQSRNAAGNCSILDYLSF